MSWDEAKKMLSEQLEVLAERTKDPNCTIAELCEIVRTTANALHVIFS